MAQVKNYVRGAGGRFASPYANEGFRQFRNAYKKKERSLTRSQRFKNLYPGYQSISDQDLWDEYKRGEYSAEEVVYDRTHARHKSQVDAITKQLETQSGIKITSKLRWEISQRKESADIAELIRTYAHDAKDVFFKPISDLTGEELSDQKIIELLQMIHEGEISRQEAAAKYISYKLWGSP